MSVILTTAANAAITRERNTADQRVSAEQLAHAAATAALIDQHTTATQTLQTQHTAELTAKDSVIADQAAMKTLFCGIYERLTGSVKSTLTKTDVDLLDGRLKQAIELMVNAGF